MSVLDWSAPFGELQQGAGFTTRGRTITETDLVMFAAVTGDMHPQHTDAEWAAGSRFGQRIAHGMLLISYAVGLVPFDPRRVLALRRIEEVVFKRPAKIGDTIHVSGSLAALKPLSAEAGLVAWRWGIHNQEQELVCRAKVEVVWATDEAAPAALGGAQSIETPPGSTAC